MASSQFLQFIDQNAQKFIGRLAEAVAIPRSVARKTNSVQDTNEDATLQCERRRIPPP